MGLIVLGAAATLKVFTDEIVFGVGVCFGAIPTHTELLIWRISCVAITVVPIYIFLDTLWLL